MQKIQFWKSWEHPLFQFREYMPLNTKDFTPELKGKASAKMSKGQLLP